MLESSAVSARAESAASGAARGAVSLPDLCALRCLSIATGCDDVGTGCREQPASRPRRGRPGTRLVTGVVKFAGAPADAGWSPRPMRQAARRESYDESLVVSTPTAGCGTSSSTGGRPERPDAGAGPGVLDQEHCRYVPHVLAVRVGQPVTVRSSDPTCITSTRTSRRTNGVQPPVHGRRPAKDVTFARAGVGRSRCGATSTSG